MSVIPSNLIVFFHDKEVMPDVFQSSLDATMCANPDFNLIFLDDDETIRLIGDRFPHFRNIYTQIRIPAARSDIARLLALYEYGGIYVDIAMAFSRSFHDLIKKDDELLLVRRDDNPVYRGRPEAAHFINGIIGAPSESRFVLGCIQRIFFNLSEGFVKFSVANATGPGVVTETFLENRSRYSFPYTVANFSTLQNESFKYRRVSGVNNSWVVEQSKGIMTHYNDVGESPQERAWREFTESL